MFDYRQLRGRIRAEGKTEAEIAKAIGVSPSAFSARINGTQEFRQNEILRTSEALKLTPEEIITYFFASKVQKTGFERSANA